MQMDFLSIFHNSAKDEPIPTAEEVRRRREEREEEEALTQEVQSCSAALLATGDGDPVSTEDLERIKSRFSGMAWERAFPAVRLQVYNRAGNRIYARGSIADVDDDWLKRLQTFLCLSDSDITVETGVLHRMRLLQRIRSGDIPSVQVPGLVLHKSERAHISEPCQLYEERVVDRHYEGATHGASIRLSKRVTYHAAVQRGYLVSRTAKIPVSTGSVIVTNQRLIFAGEPKSINLSFDKLLETHLYSDGLTFSDTVGKSHLVIFTCNIDLELFGAVLASATSLHSA
jgi:hypothetical protein